MVERKTWRKHWSLSFQLHDNSRDKTFKSTQVEFKSEFASSSTTSGMWFHSTPRERETSTKISNGTKTFHCGGSTEFGHNERLPRQSFHSIHKFAFVGFPEVCSEIF